MLKAYVIEDEPQALRLIRHYVDHLDYLELIGEERDALKGFRFLEKNHVDVLFLDINLPKLSGIDLYEGLTNPPAVIFTTAYPNHAIKGFELNALDYLLKPFTFQRFKMACDRLSNQQVDAGLHFQNEIVYIKSGAAMYKINWRDILFIKKDENYAIYHLPDKRILSRQTLNNIESVFPEYFIRVHKSYAVSLLHMETLEKEEIKILDHMIPVGRTYKEKLISALRKDENE